MLFSGERLIIPPFMAKSPKRGPYRKRARPIVDVPAPAPAIAAQPDAPLPFEPAAAVVPPGADVVDSAPTSATAAAESKRNPLDDARHPPKLTLFHNGERFLIERHNDKTIAELRKLAGNTPDLFGAAAGAAAVVEEIPDELVGGLYDAVSGVGAWLLARSGKFSPDQLRVLFLDGEERAAVTPLTKKLLNKYLPAGAGQYADELALCFILYSIFQRKQHQLADSMKGRGDVSNFPRAAAAAAPTE